MQGKILTKPNIPLIKSQPTVDTQKMKEPKHTATITKIIEPQRKMERQGQKNYILRKQ